MDDVPLCCNYYYYCSVDVGSVFFSSSRSREDDVGGRVLTGTRQGHQFVNEVARDNQKHNNSQNQNDIKDCIVNCCGGHSSAHSLHSSFVSRDVWWRRLWQGPSIAVPLCAIGPIKIILIVKRYCTFAIKIIDIENGGHDCSITMRLKSSSEKTLNWQRIK